MARSKNRVLNLHKANAMEILYCLGDNMAWAERVLSTENVYNDFLKGLLERGFYRSASKTSLKAIAGELKLDTAKMTRWIRQIYDDVFALNEQTPGLFKKDGIEHFCRFSNYDNHQCFSIWLTHTPRMYETVEIWFVKAKLGTATFMVTDVSHAVEGNGQTIYLTLKGGYCNRYREELVHRATFEKVLGIMDVLDKSQYEIDEILFRHYSKMR